METGSVLSAKTLRYFLVRPLKQLFSLVDTGNMSSTRASSCCCFASIDVLVTAATSVDADAKGWKNGVPHINVVPRHLTVNMMRNETPLPSSRLTTRCVEKNWKDNSTSKYHYSLLYGLQNEQRARIYMQSSYSRKASGKKYQ